MKVLRFIFNLEAVKVALPEKEVPVSFERALEIFDQIADRRDISFGFCEDGCHARAHLVCRDLILNDGLYAKKAWAFEVKNEDPEKNEALYIQSTNGRERVKWRFHVAPVLAVQMPDGQVQDLIFDAGLFNGPVTMRQWSRTIHARQENVQITPFGIPPMGYEYSHCPFAKIRNRDRDSKMYMRRYRRWQSTDRRAVLESNLLASQKHGSVRQGETWLTASVKHPFQPAWKDRKKTPLYAPYSALTQ